MKEKIMEATYQHIASHGYDKTSLSQIALAVSIQKSSLYHYFPSKEELFIATIIRHAKEIFYMESKLIDSIKTAEDFWEAFEYFGIDTLKSFDDDKIYQQFYFEINIQAKRIPKLSTFLDNSEQISTTQLTTFLDKGKSVDALPLSLDTTTEVQTIFALLIGLAEMLLYRMNANCNQVWTLYVKRLQQWSREPLNN